MARRSVRERMATLTYLDPMSGCWLWMGCAASDGYGKFTPAPGAFALPHRLAYELARGPIPDGLQIDHLCGVRSCVNPDHLEAVTRAENIRRSNGPSSVNARKTHCKNGHPFDDKNTYVTRTRAGRPARSCRVCNAQHVRAYLERKKAS